MKKPVYYVDESLYTTLELVQLFGFFSFIEKAEALEYEPEEIISRYNEYRSVVRNKQLEREYDKMLQEKCGVSIRKVVDNAKAALAENENLK